MLEIAIILLTFLGLAVVVDNFLVPAVYVFKNIFKWTDDQTGSIISFVSSAPELSVSAVSLFLAFINKNPSQASMGPGAVIGSAIFSILFIVGASAWFSTKKLSWPAVLRDMLYYIFSVLVVYLTVLDSKVYFWEAGLLLVVFLVYTYVVAKWKSILKYLDSKTKLDLYGQEDKVSHEISAELDQEEDLKLSIKNQSWTLKNFHVKLLDMFFFDLEDQNKIGNENSKNLTIKPNFFKISFNVALSVGFVILFSTIMVSSAESFAKSLNISPVIISLTILAAGTSIPDLLASIKTAREGYGDTAVANAVGSNIFDILANLGLTWLLAGVISQGAPISVDTENLNSSIILLIGSAVSLIMVMIAKQFHLGKVVSVLLMLSYVGYVAFEVGKALGQF